MSGDSLHIPVRKVPGDRYLSAEISGASHVDQNGLKVDSARVEYHPSIVLTVGVRMDQLRQVFSQFYSAEQAEPETFCDQSRQMVQHFLAQSKLGLQHSGNF